MGKTGLIIAAVLLAGCAAVPPPPAVEALPPATCRAEDYAGLVGTPASRIDTRTLPRAHRIICADCAATMDFSPDRLSIHLDAEGRVASVRCQ